MLCRFKNIYVVSKNKGKCDAFCKQICGQYEIQYRETTKAIRKQDERILILLDINALSVKAVSELTQHYQNSTIAFIFVEETKAVLSYLCIAGVNGLFFNNETKENICKGLQLLDEGELFFPRNLITQLVCHIRLDTNHSAAQLQRLSAKEQEILRLLSNGSSNQDVADRLNVSFHTVKTHIYNIYKKLEVKNRAEAIKLTQSVLT